MSDRELLDVRTVPEKKTVEHKIEKMKNNQERQRVQSHQVSMRIITKNHVGFK
jgi:hypothetical protein